MRRTLDAIVWIAVIAVLLAGVHSALWLGNRWRIYWEGQ